MFQIFDPNQIIEPEEKIVKKKYKNKHRKNPENRKARGGEN
jgi:hypothetical protein